MILKDDKNGKFIDKMKKVELMIYFYVFFTNKISLNLSVLSYKSNIKHLFKIYN